MTYFVHDELFVAWMLQYLDGKNQTALYEALQKLKEGSFFLVIIFIFLLCKKFDLQKIL